MENATRRWQRLDGFAAGGLMVAALLLYVTTLAPTVLEADAGEFQFVPWLPGIAHPTGYPLYVLLGWLWAHGLPVGNVAWRMNVLSAGLAALAVGLTYALARRIVAGALPQVAAGAQVAGAAVAGATFAVTPTFWSQAIIAEVYALHALLVALLLWLALRVAAQQSPGWLLALTFGLGLTHHVTTILLLPALLLFLWLNGRRRNRPNTSFLDNLKWLAHYGLIAALPLLLYLYLPLAAPSTPYATLHLSESQTLTLYDNSLAGWLQHVTATVFSGQVQPAAVGIERFTLTGQLLHAQFGWAGLALALLGLLTLGRQRRDLLALTGLAFALIVGFNLIYFIGDVFVLFIPAWLIVSLWLGVGVVALASRSAVWFVRRKTNTTVEATVGQVKERLAQNMVQLVTLGLTCFFFALPVALLAANYSAVSQQDNFRASQRWQEILAEPLPEAAVLLSNDRNEIMPMWYFQYVERQRPDLIGLFPLIVTDPAYQNVGRVLDQALASARPVYLIKAMDGLALKARLTSAGTLVRAEPYDAPARQSLDAPLPPLTLPDGHPLPAGFILHGVDLPADLAAPGDNVAVTLHWQITAPLAINVTSYVHLLTAGGQRVAQSDHRPGGDYYPSSLWQPGETLRDRHTLTLPADLPPGTYHLRTGVYFQPDPGVFAGAGDGLEFGVLHVN